MSDRNCPRCGGLLAADATWCGQCYLDFRARRRVPSPPLPPRPDLVDAAAQQKDASFDRVWIGAPQQAAEAEPPAGWPCPGCGFSSPMSSDRCQICGTPFAKLFDEPARRRPRVEPEKAVLSSLLLPGLGHARCGRLAEGIARGVLFAWAFVTGLLLMLVHLPTGAGPLSAVGWLFFVAAGAVYLVSALDSYRLASGEDQILSPKTLLYGSAGLVAMSMVSLLMLVFKVSGKLPHVPHIRP